MAERKRKTEHDILHRALEALRKTASPRAKIEVQAPGATGSAVYGTDLTIRMTLHRRALVYRTEIRPVITKAQSFLLLMDRRQRKAPVLLVTGYVNPEMAEELRQNGIEFIDTAGNMFIDQPPVYIFVKGNKVTERIGPATVKRAFKGAGLKMIYAFLCDHGLAGRTYREIVAATGVALGTVDRVMRELKEFGYIIDFGKQGFKVVRKEDLFQRWVTAYPEQLRPKQLLGRYRGDPGWWEQKRLDPSRAQWGGEVAATKMTGYLKPEMITLYTAAEQLNPILLENRLRRDEKGNVEVLERFWLQTNAQKTEETVHPILIYADLLATGHQRNLETAKLIYEQYILRLNGKD